jgi:hypothetical protein
MIRRDDVSSSRTLLSAALTLVLVGLVALVLRVSAQDRPAAPTAASTNPPPSQAVTDRSQPIAFSHRIHSGTNAIPCQLCHIYARRGPVAGIPSVQRCVQCHQTIAPEDPEVVKLMAFWKDRKPIAWNRVHDLLDYVRFTHKPHVAGVGVSPVTGRAKMDGAVRTESLSMGWCLNCHKERHAPTDCLVCHYEPGANESSSNVSADGRSSSCLVPRLGGRGERLLAHPARAHHSARHPA